MMIVTFCMVLAMSILAAALARRGQGQMTIKQFLTAGRSLPTLMIFFLTLGETISLSAMTAFPGGIFARGASYGYWYLGFVLLGYPAGYFIAPLIWRAAARYDALTVPDVFRRHYSSRILELVIAWTSLVALVGWGTFQFIGMLTILRALGVRVSPAALLAISAAFALCYTVLGGMRANAFVAILKDIFMLLGLTAVGLAVIYSAGSISAVFSASAVVVDHLKIDGISMTFAISTVLYQSLGFHLQPSVAPYVFAARSEPALKRAMIFMPMYSLMFSFAVLVAFYALKNRPDLADPNLAFFTIATEILPPWIVGMVAAGAALAGLLVLSATSLSVGAIVTRNVIPNIVPARQRTSTIIAVSLFLIAAATLTLIAPKLMVTVLNVVSYVGIQVSSAWVAMFFARKTPPAAIILGVVSGTLLAMTLFVTKAPSGGVNVGLIGLAVNFILLFGYSALFPSRQRRVPISQSQAAACA